MNTQNLLYKNSNIAYSVSGKGNAVVLLHGFLENSTMWNYLTPILSEKNKVICIDLLGHGKTDCLGYVHTMTDMAMAVQHVLTELKTEKAVFIGHSMGGYVALALAKLFPETIKGLVLQNSTAYADSTERIANRTRAIKAVKQNYIAAVRMSISNLFTEENREKCIEQINWIREEALKTTLQGIVAAQEGMKLRENLEVILVNTKFDKLLILGKKDPVLNYEDNLKQIENTNTKLVTFNDGHMSHIENKEALETEIISFLEQIKYSQ